MIVRRTPLPQIEHTRREGDGEGEIRHPGVGHVRVHDAYILALEGVGGRREEADVRRDTQQQHRHRAEPGLRCHTSSITTRSEEHTSELQSRFDLVCRLLLEKKKKNNTNIVSPIYVISR